jgi:tRNA threonylcarbamoyl adenosine modification protein YeaZ
LKPETAPLLAIETSGQSAGVALHAESGIVFEENMTAGMIHGRALAPLLEKALASGNLDATELEAVAVSLGPGSWTGLRIGLSAAKTLAWAAGLKLVGVSSFEALAHEAGVQAPAHAVLTVRDARSAGFFVALFAETHGVLERWIPESVLPIEEVRDAVARALAERGTEQLEPQRTQRRDEIHGAKSSVSSAASVVRSCGGNPVAVCGDAKCLEALADTARALGWRLLPELAHIPARAVAHCGWERLKRGAGVLSSAAEIHRLSPLYLRASDPELKLRTKVKPQMNADERR